MNSNQPNKQLSIRELEILKLLAGGASNEKIANALFISINTVKTHVSSIYQKLGVNNRTEAATKAISNNLVNSS